MVTLSKFFFEFQVSKEKDFLSRFCIWVSNYSSRISRNCTDLFRFNGVKVYYFIFRKKNIINIGYKANWIKQIEYNNLL